MNATVEGMDADNRRSLESNMNAPITTIPLVNTTEVRDGQVENT